MRVCRRRLLLATCVVCIALLLLMYYDGQTKLEPCITKAQQEESHAAQEIPTSPVIQHARSRIVFYNRVPKCGSRSILSVLELLAERNNFTELTSSEFSDMRPDNKKLEQLVKEIANLAPPIVYNRHLYYIDFRKYGYKQPVYINLLRDPIDRFSSHYNYIKYGDVMGESDSPDSSRPDINVCVLQDLPVCLKYLRFYEGAFFCGMDPVCPFPSRKSVEIAKEHLNKEYLLVGILEEFENTLKLFEKMLPEYFNGAVDIWKAYSLIMNSTETIKHDALSQESREKLRNFNLQHEYEIYNFAKSKFDRLKNKYGIK